MREVELGGEVARPHVRLEGQSRLGIGDLDARMGRAHRGAFHPNSFVEHDLSDERELLQRLGARHVSERPLAPVQLDLQVVAATLEHQ